MQYLLLYILDTVLQFVYNGLHYVTQSDTDVAGVSNCDFNTSPSETGDFNVCSVSLKTLCMAKIIKKSS